MRRALINFPAIILLGACSTLQDAKDHLVGGASIADAAGRTLGSAVLTENAAGLNLAVLVTGQTPGKRHGIHLHASGACQGPAFASAGSHLNPAGRQHGSENPAGSHLGDLPNLVINAAGAGRLTINLPGNPEALRASLFDNDGTAIVLHADPDDLRTDPSGNSGTRIACGALLPNVR
jgi:superoxide dismutase, Cu-Zn family